jgi:alanine dehydrogenase
VVDAVTGRPVALMDGTYLTALRTGAASGVATELLARPDARVAAVFGAGAQARTQLEAVCTVRPIDRVRVYDTSREAATAYAEEMRTHGQPIPPDIAVAASAAEAVRDADVICTATTATTPVFSDADLKPGVHVNAIGAYTPEMQEIPAETVARATIVVDSRSASLAEAGDLIIPLRSGLISEDSIRGEIGQVAAGQIPGRLSPDEVTFFKSVGVAVQDVAVADLVLQRAVSLGLGMEVEL